MTEKVEVEPRGTEREPPLGAVSDDAAESELPPTPGLVVDPQDERFQQGKADGFTAWWNHEKYDPQAADEEYVQGYDFGWEMASDPLHEDSRDPHLAPTLQPDYEE